MMSVPPRDQAARSIDAFQRYHGMRRGDRGAAIHAHGTYQHLFKRANPSYPLATENMTMNLGFAVGYSGAHPDEPAAIVRRPEELC
jgi:hypothetical protein